MDRALNGERFGPDHEVEPGGKEPAPGDLWLVQRFVNSIDIEEGVEELDTPAALARWLYARGLTRSLLRLTEAHLDRARRFRELLRAMALANNGVPMARAKVREVDQAFASLPLRTRFDGSGGGRLEGAGTGLDRALGTIAAIVTEEMVRGRWPRLKACIRDVCHWVFYDHSRNRTGTWCTMAICGSRTKMKTYYRRQHPSHQARRTRAVR